MVWAKASEIGCAIAECSSDLYSYFYHYFYYYYLHQYHYYRSGSENKVYIGDNPETYKGPIYFLVCNYGTGVPEDPFHAVHQYRPYLRGLPCHYCPKEYPSCDYRPYYYHYPPPYGPDISGYASTQVYGDTGTSVDGSGIGSGIDGSGIDATRVSTQGYGDDIDDSTIDASRAPTRVYGGIGGPSIAGLCCMYNVI